MSEQNSGIDWLRSFKILKIAMFDVVMTLAFGILFIRLLKLNVLDGIVFMMILFMVGMITHFVVGVDSQLNRYLFGC
jgi:hypothetical protein